jgi:hypothetical protein
MVVLASKARPRTRTFQAMRACSPRPLLPSQRLHHAVPLYCPFRVISDRSVQRPSASYTQVSPLFEFGLVANADAGSLKRNRTIAFEILQHALGALTRNRTSLADPCDDAKLPTAVMAGPYRVHGHLV